MLAQNVTVLTSRHGLSNSCIRNMYEDKRHNVWITTQNGLNRYDGNKFNMYRHNEKDTTSLVCDESTCMVDFQNGKLLVGTARGAQIYDYATDKFTFLPFVRMNGDTISPYIVSMCEIGKNKFVVCTAGYGLGMLYRSADGMYSILSTEDYLLGKEEVVPSCLYKDKKGCLWAVGGDKRLYRRMKGKDKVYPSLAGVKNVCESKSGCLYVATAKNGIYVYDRKKDCFSMVVSSAEAGAYVECVKPWNEGRVFICTDGNGLRAYDEKTGKVLQSVIRANDFSMESSNVKDALADSFGNVWVGVYWRGVMLKSNNQSPFDYVGRLSLGKNTIGDNSVFSLAKAKDGGIWVSTCNDGLYLMSADGSSSQHMAPLAASGDVLSFTSMASTSGGGLLLGTWNDGLWLMENGHFSCVSTEINNIFEVRRDVEPGCYWISSMSGGFYYYDLAHRKQKNYRPDWSKGSRGALIIGNPYVSSVMPVGGFVYVGTADGLTLCYHDGNGTITRTSIRVLENVYVHQLALSPDKKTLWVASNNGLYKMNAANYTYKRYTVADGLPNNNVVSLAPEGDKLWIGTGYGLACMDVKSGKMTSYLLEDGLQDNEFNRGASLVVGRRCYFGGIGGLTYFDGDKIEGVHAKHHKWHLRMVDVMVGGRTVHKGDLSDGYEILTDEIDGCERVDLSYKENHFAVELCIDGLYNHHVVYEYSINGGEWVNYGVNGNKLVFENLNNGVNEIRMRAASLGSISDERVLTVVIHPAWYASGWAVFVYFVLAVLFGMMLFEYSKRRKEAKEAEAQHLRDKQMDEARIQFFMNISHEIRTPMTLIMSPLERLIGSDKDGERQHLYQVMKDNAKRILRLVNQLMDVRKIEQGKFQINPVDTEVVAFVRNIYEVFLTNAKTRNITYRFVSDVDKMNVFVDQSSLDKIMMNLLSNAFKFTSDGGEVVIELHTGRERFSISVCDTGVGIKDEDKPTVFKRFFSSSQPSGYTGTGIGLNLVQLLVHLHKGTVAVEDNPKGKGTLFRVVLPVGTQDVYADSPEENVPDAEITEADKPERDGDGADETESGNAAKDAAGADCVCASSGAAVVELCADVPTVCVEECVPDDLHRHKAVLVEDDESIRIYVQNELADILCIHACSNGQEAWDYITSHHDRVQLVISDIMMPVMDGMTLCQKLKSNYLTLHIPVILMTALGDDANRIAGLTNGADAYMSKPFNIDVLRTTALQLVKSRMMLHGKYMADKRADEDIERLPVPEETSEERLMKRIMGSINDNLTNSSLSVELIAKQLGMSRVQLYRRMKDMTGQSPRDFIKYVRVKEAARLLATNKYDVTGVSVATGFKSLSTFCAAFKSLYDMTPSEWMKKSQEEGADNDE